VYQFRSLIFLFMATKKKATEKEAREVKYSAESYSFFENVWDVARLVPKGRVTSYGAIARYLGTGRSARMVGWAMNAVGGVKPKVPAHRVVNSQGLLTGKHHFKTPTLMQELLEKEKVKVKNDQVVDFKKVFWDPMTELG
jgi:methylated-DNA-protein-cysteine methyltransferase related protein